MRESDSAVFGCRIAWRLAIVFGWFVTITIAHAQPRVNPSNAPVEGGLRVSGVVTLEDGAPHPGAEVNLLRRGSYYGKYEPRKTKADAAGRFAFDGVDDGEFRLWSIDGNLVSRDKRSQGTTIKIVKAAGQFEPVKLVLRPGRIVRATIVSAADGKPIPGASIRLRVTDIGSDFDADAQGHVTIQGLTAESWSLEAVAPGKAMLKKDVNLASATETEVEFSLADGGSLSGKVTDASGKPLAGVGVNIYPGSSGMWIDYTVTAADGVYRSDHLPLDQELRINVYEDAYAPLGQTTDLPRELRNRELNLTLQPKPAGGSVVGKVTDADGKPVANAEVSSGARGRSAKSVMTDEAGAFRLDGIDARILISQPIIVRAAGWAPYALTNIQPGTAEAPLQVNVKLTEKGHRIAGRVINEKDEPISGAYVDAGKFTVSDDRRSSTRTDANGRFKFDSLPSKATFDFSATGYTDIDWKELTLDGENEVVVIMQRAGALAGKVIDADTGQPLPKFNIKIRSTGIDSRRVESGEDFGNAAGEFRLDELLSGSKIMLTVSAPGYPVQYVDNVIPTPGAEGQPLVIRLSKTPADQYRIAGRIIDSDGKPVEGVEVYVVAYRPTEREFPREMRFNWGMLKSGQLRIQDYIRSIHQIRTSAEGTFEFAGEQGPDVDLAYWGKTVPHTRLKDVGRQPPEQLGWMELKIPPPSSIAGRINRNAMADLTGLTLRFAADPSMRIELRIKNEDARYEFPAVAAGSYTLMLNGKPIGNGDGTFRYPEIGTRNIEVKDGESLQLDLGFESSPTTKPQ